MKLVEGFGVNDAIYPTSTMVEGRQVFCPFYVKWASMLRRCYSKKMHKRRPTYIICSTCNDWQSFMAFRTWMNEQDWIGKDLDKDFLGDGTLYSPETCCFVPPWLNVIFTGPRGLYPKGVSKAQSCFKARLCVDGKCIFLGRFTTIEEASRTYQKAKHDYVINKMVNYPNTRIRNAVLAKLDEENE